MHYGMQSSYSNISFLAVARIDRLGLPKLTKQLGLYNMRVVGRSGLSNLPQRLIYETNICLKCRIAIVILVLDYVVLVPYDTVMHLAV